MNMYNMKQQLLVISNKPRSMFMFEQFLIVANGIRARIISILLCPFTSRGLFYEDRWANPEFIWRYGQFITSIYTNVGV